MTLHQSRRHRQDAPTSGAGTSGGILPVRRDGEPVTDPAFALPLPPDFVPWERVVAAYLARFAPPPQRAAA
jgi:hypothetical protein